MKMQSNVTAFSNIVIDDEDEHTITAGALTTLIINLKRTSLATLIGKDDSDVSKLASNHHVVEQLNSLEAGEDNTAAGGDGESR